MIVGSWWLPLTFSYDHLTSLLTCVGLLLIIRSVTARNRTGAVCLALASGLVLGMNTFARIPNVLGFAYILLIPIGRRHQSMCSRVLKQATVAASPVYFPLSSLSLQVWQ